MQPDDTGPADQPSPFSGLSRYQPLMIPPRPEPEVPAEHWSRALTHAGTWKLPGLNGLGMVQVAIVGFTLVLWPEAHNQAERVGIGIVAFSVGLLVAVLDCSWRVVQPDHRGVIRWLGPTAGGSIILLPGWLVGAVVAGFGVRAVLVNL